MKVIKNFFLYAAGVFAAIVLSIWEAFGGCRIFRIPGCGR